MNTHHNQALSLKSLCIKHASTACMAGLLAVACTPTSQQPLSQATSQSAPAQEIPVATPVPLAKPTTTPTPATPTSAAIPPTRTPTSAAPKPTPSTPATPKPVASAPASIPQPTSQPQDCKITNAKIADPNPPANVRSSPEVKPDNIVGKIENGRIIGVLSQKNGWFEISEPKGWVYQNITEFDCSQKTQRINFAPNTNSAIISGRFIGTGSHIYLLNAKQGQTLTVKAEEGPLPFIFPPNDTKGQKDLTGGGDYSGKKTWTGQLPATGDYTLDFESNFRGYNYKLSIEVR